MISNTLRDALVNAEHFSYKSDIHRWLSLSDNSMYIAVQKYFIFKENFNTKTKQNIFYYNKKEEDFLGGPHTNVSLYLRSIVTRILL